MNRYGHPISETQRKRSLNQRMVIVHGILLIALLIIVARLLELQIFRGNDYRALAQSQHFGGVVLPARRGEVLSRNSKTGEASILATNTTLDLVYVDPLITDNPSLVAETLSDILVTDAFHQLCVNGNDLCPRELTQYYAAAFDPLDRVQHLQSGSLLEPLRGDFPSARAEDLPDLTEVRRLFARSIEDKISEKRVTYVPLVYGATKIQMDEVQQLGVTGVEVSQDQYLIYADPENINQLNLASIARRLSGPLEMDSETLENLLRSRPLRYVPVMNRLPPELSLKIQDRLLQSFEETVAKKQEAPTRAIADQIQDPLRSIALIPEHWRFYPDSTLGSHVIGFLNPQQEAQYGVERTFDPQLRGQEGLISAVSDLQGRQIVTGDQTIINPKDGDTIVLTIDRFVQKKIETLLDETVKRFDADSAQVIVMDPVTGKIIAMVNAPLFDSNNYGTVYDKEPIFMDEKRQSEIVVELYHPETNEFIVKAYYDDVFTEGGRELLSPEKLEMINNVMSLYDLEDVARYYMYIGENSRREIFPTNRKDVWLKYRNNLGVGAYLNRTIQEIYEPGSVMKSVTMAIAIDQGEVTPSDMYDDTGPVRIDEYTIKNALNTYYGKVNMTNCLEYSINTCMTFVSEKLGKKLFHRMLERFGFGRITGVELDDELPGAILPWRQWSNALLATASYGQGVSSTPLQMITAYSALANGGRLIKPTIIDSVIHNDGTVEKKPTVVIDQVITPETSETITAMLVSSVNNGFAKVARVDGYRIAGKTGTSQIAGPGGKYETGTGSTIATFAGYGPVPDPRFMILVKFNRPRKDIYGSQTAGPVFGEIAKFLFEYYGIAPTGDQR